MYNIKQYRQRGIRVQYVEESSLKRRALCVLSRAVFSTIWLELESRIFILKKCKCMQSDSFCKRKYSWYTIVHVNVLYSIKRSKVLKFHSPTNPTFINY
jgi:hypothetical protein